MKRKALFIVPALLAMFVASCGGGGGGGSTPKKSDFTNVNFESMSVTYDGESHKLGDVTGDIPTGTNISYVGRGAYTNVGSYSASATLSKDGYNDLTLNAVLTITKAAFPSSTYTFNSVTTNYDGSEHINDVIFVGELPANTTKTITVKDSSNTVVTSAIDVGAYSYSCKLENSNYETLTLNATLTINAVEFGDLTFDSKTVTYDGSDHINDIQVVGFLPQGTTATTTVKNSDGVVVTSAIDVDTYSYTCVLKNKNYVTKTLNATLTIKQEKRDMPVFKQNGGALFFNNGLHNQYLYSLDSESTLRLVDHSSVKSFDKSYFNNYFLYTTKSLISNSVKLGKADGYDTIYSSGKVVSAVKYSDTVYYLAVSSLQSAKAGIYRLTLKDNEEPVLVQMLNCKCKSLIRYQDYLYYINESDSDNLYRFSVDMRVNTLISDDYNYTDLIRVGNYLYMTTNGLLNDCICYYDLTNANAKVHIETMAAGDYLACYEDYLYYYYTDFYSVIDPSKKGIWRTKHNSNPEQVLAIDGISGLAVEDNEIYYTNSNDLHVYKYNTNTKTTVDLLADFVAPEETPMNTGGKTISVGNKTYYLDMYAGKSLHVYDEISKTKTQLTSSKVEDFVVKNNIMYFNQVTLLTNSDVYSVDLSSGGIAEKINANDLRNMYVNGDYIYGTHYNFVGTAGGIARMKLDGSEYVKFSEINGAKNFEVKDNKLYFVNCGTGQDNGYIEYIDASAITPESEKMTSTRLSNNIKNVKQFEFDGNNIFYIYNGLTDNSVRRTDFTSLGEGTKIASSKTNPNEIILNGDYVYYYSYAASAASSAGFYKVSKTASGDGFQELLVGYDSKYFGSNLSISDAGYMYFLNYIPKLTFGDAHFYQIKLSTKTVTKIN